MSDFKGTSNPENSIVNQYIEKWNNILFSTKKIECQKAILIAKNAYKLLELPDVKWIFLSSPRQVDQYLINMLDLSLYTTVKHYLKNRLTESIWTNTGSKYFSSPYGGNKYAHLNKTTECFSHLCEIVYSDCAILLEEHIFYEIFYSEFLDTNPWLYDFHINHISDECDLEIWNMWKSLCEECPYLIAFNNACIIIDRPTELYLDRELRPHANGKAAIKFADGYEIYCNHGVIIPANYGKINFSNWRSEWILTEHLTEDNKDTIETLLGILHSNIGYKKFCEELPDKKDKYWENHRILIADAIIGVIIPWHFFHYHDLYGRVDDIAPDITFEKFIANLPFKLSHELYCFYQNHHTEKHQLAPGLYSCPKKQAIQNQITELGMYSARLFHGDRQEIYYVLCDNEERMISPVYCQFPEKEPVIYAECFTSLIMTIAQCYQEGAYYIAVDEETGEKSIQQDLDAIEPIFEKFNPDQIDNWRKIWKSNQNP